jgi:hypothetical protein
MFRLILTSLLTVFAVADHPLYSTECLHAWEPLTVIQWARASYSENENFIAALEKMKINGKVLKMLDDLDFKDDLGITSSILRKKILLEVQDLASACEKKEPDYINDDDDYTPDHEVNAKDPATAKILRRMKEASDKKNAMKDSNDVSKKDDEQESYLWKFFDFVIKCFCLFLIFYAYLWYQDQQKNRKKANNALDEFSDSVKRRKAAAFNDSLRPSSEVRKRMSDNLRAAEARSGINRKEFNPFQIPNNF